MLSFKLALKEILEAATASGEPLEGICDGILGSSVEPLPHDYNKFITLGEYDVGAVRIGHMQNKFREVTVNIDCGAVVRAGKQDAEVDAEEAAYSIAQAVQNVLKANKKLISTSYPSGLAIVSEPVDEFLQYLIYDEVPVAVNTVSYYIKMEET